MALWVEFTFQPGLLIHVLLWVPITAGSRWSRCGSRKGCCSRSNIATRRAKAGSRSSEVPRFPLIPTIVVGLAIASMIGLGVWQLDRRAEKHAALALYAANLGKPAMAFPRRRSDDQYLFRRARPSASSPSAGRARAGGASRAPTAIRQIAQCRTGAEGPALLVDVGVAPDPKFKPDWKGGAVTGTITHAPDHQPIIASCSAATPSR
jgi:surfeit locus 1 family protein